ncbi:MAG: 5'/3'-nucleotidase SurE [Mariniblastus sp.]
MKFLLTNDDGWGYDGLKVLEEVASEFGEVWTVAPAGPMSGISHKLTFEHPLTLLEKAPQSFSLDGTPADCVRVALDQLDVEFDWVLSGVNRGANLGSDVNVSGTVAAVREASLFNCKGIAFSQHLRKFNSPFDWSKSSSLAKRILPQLFKSGLQVGGWMNVNFPDVGDGDLKAVPFEVVELDRNPLPVEYEKTEDGKLLYCAKYSDRVRTPGRDADVCFSGCVSITSH